MKARDDDCRGYVAVFPGILVPYRSHEERIEIIEREIRIWTWIFFGGLAIAAAAFIWLAGLMAGWW